MKYKLLALSLALTSLHSFAGTTSVLLLKGTIPRILNIAVSPEPIASTLDLTVSQSAMKVATVQEKSNSRTGYKVTIQSGNGGNLKNGTYVFPYTLSYNNVNLNLNSAVVQINAASNTVTVNKDVKISYTGVPSDSLKGGDYTDTITFTIAVN